MHNHSKLIKAEEIINILENHRLLVGKVNLNYDLTFSKFETDSRRIEKGDIFVCIKGYNQDGHEFASKALENGADLIVTEVELEYHSAQFIVNNSRKAAALLAKLFFDDPSARFTLIGITGTNGKTTIANLLGDLLRKEEKKVGIIGTLGYKINDKDYPSQLTTPDVIELNSIFQQMLLEKVEYVIMEVSSHSLFLDRVYGLNFNQAVFTNLTRDHLDFHKNMEAYFEAKAQLFQLIDKYYGSAHINIDDSYGLKLYEDLNAEKFGISFESGDITISDISIADKNSSFSYAFDSKIYKFKTSFIAKHNVLNISLALSVFLKFFPDTDEAKLNSYLSSMSPVHGRLEAIQNELGISIYVDYAHTPDALENVLGSLVNLKKGRLITIFGAGGNRDKEKRPLMLKSALKHSDLTIITNDNPRTEPAESIINDIVAGTPSLEKFYIIRDREKAIKTALKMAGKNDIILIAGKGHEKYQQVGDRKIPFYDRKVVENFLTAAETIPPDQLFLPLDLLQVVLLFGSLDMTLDNTYFEHISTDSRTIKPNSLFIALKGDKFDGHDYVQDVLKTENCWAIVNRDYAFEEQKIIRVEDTVKALGDLAAKYANLFSALKIAITGSVGKTMTKEYLSNILSLIAPALKTHSNENNLIGLPKTIFKLRPEHKYAILELGSNQFGEIARLSDICNPDMAVITSIGASHLEFFQDEAGVFEEKKALFDRKLKLRFFPGEDIRFKQYFGITFGTTKDCDYRISNVTKTQNQTEFQVNEETYYLPTLYDTFTQNALIAISICKELAIGYEYIQKGLNRPLSVPHRMEILQKGEMTVLADCYNANPQSMKAAVKFWSEYQAERPHVAILGDMLELGELAAKLHENIGDILKTNRAAKIISVGQLAKNYKAERHFNNVEELNNSSLESELPADAVVLVKASHGIQLEKFIERIEK